MNAKFKISLHKKSIAYLLLFSIIMSTGTFAYWTNSVVGVKSSSTKLITIGSADAVDTHFNINNDFMSGGYLVPIGQLTNSEPGAVEEINLTYDINWKESEDISQLEGSDITGKVRISYKLNITRDGRKINRKDYRTLSKLIHILQNENNPDILTLGSESEVFRFKVNIDEPKNLSEYNLLSSVDISIVISFKISDRNVSITK